MNSVPAITILCLRFAAAQLTLTKIYALESIVLKKRAESIDIFHQDQSLDVTLGRLIFRDGKMTIFENSQFKLSYKRGASQVIEPSREAIVLHPNDLVYVRLVNPIFATPGNQSSFLPMSGDYACFRVVVDTETILPRVPLLNKKASGRRSPA